MTKNELYQKTPDELEAERQAAFVPDETPEDEEAPALADGTVLRYNVEDSGQIHPDIGLWLAPGYDYAVPDDLSGELAHRLAERGFLKVHASVAAEEPPSEVLLKEESVKEESVKEESVKEKATAAPAVTKTTPAAAAVPAMAPAPITAASLASAVATEAAPEPDEPEAA